MTAGFIFVIAILVLGGVIATVSDRLGTKVGKARLRLFNLRPRSTAVVVTVATGTVLSGLTLGILFAASKPLRRGVFRIDEIQERLNQSRKDLTRTEDEKERVEDELDKAKEDLAAALAQINQANFSLDQVNTQATETETQLKQSQSKLNQLQSQLGEVKAAKTKTESELNNTESELDKVFEQKQFLESEIAKLQAEQQKLIKQREQVEAQIQQQDRQIQQQDIEIAERDQVIAQREELLEELESQKAELESQNDQLESQKAELESQNDQLEGQKADLESQKADLKDQIELVERDFILLREGSVVLKRGEVLASALVRIKNPDKLQQAVEQLLQQANRKAVSSVQLGNTEAGKEQVLQITKTEVEELMQEIDDGRDYVVQVISAANYLAGEKRVAVFTKAELNRLLFSSGEVIAGTSVQPSTLSNDELQQELEQLLDASRFRARFVGVVDGLIQIGDARVDTLVNFFEQLQEHDQSLELQAVASEDTYTIGPLKIDLLARRNGEIIFSTRPQEQPSPSLTEPETTETEDDTPNVN